MGKKKKTGTEVSLDEINIILKIPKEAVALEVTASLIDEDGNVQKVSKRLTVADIRDARQDFLDNVEFGDEYDAKFVLTEEGEKYLEQLKKNRQEGINI